ncbi:GyrI-like domain-containing protein [Aneurinibacillus migulanus]|uniref:Predicted transcriptional regulator YdeE, contains AraC-type DNA-binding domain n=1 Tax=Aneurinibacillus migulanus TaxID=47500 RepID=A0A0M0H6R7_ANEMI|nr:GyrI-like domain-containing protein [Aneurinibacillus migulanus]KON97784.1 hypothetical protein AF333_22465 [Aneurinibacillus migulanus]MED0894647.1 GyrI-like domain-containing protein [Aneurinibacillus migulanus]MED1619378.1 GyrI-like domain-containing protein [Aneurinibacillus migulanus]SDJ74738.1 Predicted transcriptional regulator YdeE, contains AraC-type DNA-binding domain [Aneurinibacillus migulanus]GED17932.1 DNA-binding protein [Aneurinibacillus migulanus]
MIDPRIITSNEMNVIGVATQTTNQREAEGNGEIPKLWGRFATEQIDKDIPNKQRENQILSVYTDYENGVHGKYSYIIGSQVSNFSNVPDGMVAKRIPHSTYAVFTSNKGDISTVVPEAWAFIWSWFQESDMERAFTYDFELYDERSLDRNNAEVDIYIAIK